MDKHYMETALTLARMYGVAETLHPWDYLDHDKFISKIQDWTEEFLRTENKDIVRFFESKIMK